MTTDKQNKFDQLYVNLTKTRHGGLPKISFKQLYPIACQLTAHDELQKAINFSQS